MARKLAIGAACVVVVAACVWWTLPKGDDAVPRERLLQTHVCEACGHAYSAVAGADAARCPKCRKREGVRVHRYVCDACSETFEAFREREIGAAGQPPRLEYKQPGGEWVESSETLGPTACPKCSSPKVTPAGAKAKAPTR